MTIPSAKFALCITARHIWLENMHAIFSEIWGREHLHITFMCQCSWLSSSLVHRWRFLMTWSISFFTRAHCNFQHNIFQCDVLWFIFHDDGRRALCGTQVANAGREKDAVKNANKYWTNDSPWMYVEHGAYWHKKCIRGDCISGSMDAAQISIES